MSIVDLTQSLSNDIPHFPGDIQPNIYQTKTLEKDGVACCNMHISSHHGTHMDAPSHFVEGTASIDQISPHSFFGKGVVIRLEEGKQPDVSHVQKDEWVLFNTGWSSHWSSKDYYNQSPTIDEKTAELLANKKIKGVGVDAFSVDRMDAHDAKIHKILLKEGVMIVENLTNLDKLEGKHFDFIGMPLKIKDCDGSPIRAVARVLEGPEQSWKIEPSIDYNAQH